MKQPITLVTGAAGFIGSHVADELISKGHRVVGLDDLSGGFVNNVPDGVTFVKGSITDHELVDQLFDTYRFDYVIHTAAYAAEGLSHFIRRYNYENNLIGSVNLINASVRLGTVKCFTFTSSMAVYGSNQVPMVEDMTPMPEDPYGNAKYSVELDLAGRLAGGEEHELLSLAPPSCRSSFEARGFAVIGEAVEASHAPTIRWTQGGKLLALSPRTYEHF